MKIVEVLQEDNEVKTSACIAGVNPEVVGINRKIPSPFH